MTKKTRITYATISLALFVVGLYFCWTIGGWPIVGGIVLVQWADNLDDTLRRAER
jgi:hypothetical protein